MGIRYVQTTDWKFWKKLDKHISKRQFERKVQNQEGYILMENDVEIGILRFQLFWEEIPFCTMLYIAQDNQYQGFGKALMKHWEDDMRKQGYKLVLTSTRSNEDAQFFYRKLGYQDCGELRIEQDVYAQPKELFLQKWI